MDVSPALHQALERLSGSCGRRLRLDTVRRLLSDSVQSSENAVWHARGAWDQLESMTCNVLPVFRLVDHTGAEDLKVAFKKAKVVTRDRVVWQAMGRFRDILDMKLSLEYLSDIVKGDHDRMSQLSQAYVKIHSDMLLQMMGRRDCWGAFLQYLWQNSEDTDVQLALYRLEQFEENGLQIESDYESLMQLPPLVLQAMSDTNTKILLPDDARIGPVGPSSDIASLHRSLELLGGHLCWTDFLRPVQEKFNASLLASKLAVQAAVEAWAVLQHQALQSGFWSSKSRKSDDEGRKFHKLENLILQEIILTGCAYGGLSDVRFLEHLLCREIRFKGMPVDVSYLMSALKTKHASMQREIWQELVCSEQTWARTVQKISKNMRTNDNQ